jgi:hypothetical protein
MQATFMHSIGTPGTDQLQKVITGKRMKLFVGARTSHSTALSVKGATWTVAISKRSTEHDSVLSRSKRCISARNIQL